MYHMEANPKKENRFSIVKRARSFNHAARGLSIVLRTQPNIIIHILSSLIVLILGFFYHISHFEWIILIFAVGMVMAAEAFNTAIEIDIDLTSPDYHPFARDTKDVAAGAVLITAFTALVIGLIIFVPKMFT